MINFTKKYIYSFSSALQKRHVQIHDLRSRLNNTGFKIGELQNINSKKDELIKALEQQLGKEKREVDSMKIELDKVGREKSNVLISRIFLPIHIHSTPKLDLTTFVVKPLLFLNSSRSLN